MPHIKPPYEQEGTTLYKLTEGPKPQNVFTGCFYRHTCTEEELHATVTFLRHAAACHAELLAALEAVWTTLEQAHQIPPIVTRDLAKTAREAWLKAKGESA